MVSHSVNLIGVTLTILDYMNRNGSNIGSKVLMIVVAVLNAGRNSFSFFLLLIVCMGYGVVKHSLGKTMIYVRYLAGAHFVFGLIYSIASLTVTPETAGKCYITFEYSHLTKARASCALCHSSIGRYSDSILCLDTQLSQHDHEGPHGAQANAEILNVPKIVVGNSRLDHGHFRILLLQLLYLCLGIRSRLCTVPLEDPLVRSGWMAQSRLSWRCCFHCLHVEANSKQQEVRYE